MNQFPKNDSKIGEAAKRLAMDLIRRDPNLSPEAAVALTDASQGIYLGDVVSDPDKGRIELPPITEADNPTLRFSPGSLAISSVVNKPR